MILSAENTTITDNTTNITNQDIEIATHDRLGIVRIGNTLDIDVNGILDLKEASNIPIATEDTIGGIKIGQNVHVNSEGVAWIPPATTTQLGTIKSGGDINVNTDGTVTINPVPATMEGNLGAITVTPNHGLTLNDTGDLRVIPATNATIGGVVVDDDTLEIGTDGLLRVKEITIPVATSTKVGGIISAGDISVNENGKVSINYKPATMEGKLGCIKLVTNRQGLVLTDTGNLSLIPATYEILGGIIPDPNSLEITETGLLSVKEKEVVIPIATEDKVGGIKSGGEITVNGDGNIKINYIPATMEGKLGAIKLLSSTQGLSLSTAGNLSVVPATYETIGGIIADNNTLQITENGILSVKGGLDVPIATETKVGGIKSGGDISVDSEGKVTVESSKVSKATYNEATGALKLNIEVVS